MFLTFPNPTDISSFSLIFKVFLKMFVEVHVTIAGTLQEDLTNIKASEFSFIDINTEKPLVVIGNQVFTGEFQVGDLRTFETLFWIKNRNNHWFTNQDWLTAINLTEIHPHVLEEPFRRFQLQLQIPKILFLFITGEIEQSSD